MKPRYQSSMRSDAVCWRRIVVGEQGDCPESLAGDVGANLRLDSHVHPSSTPTRKEAKTRRREAVAIGRACTITWLFFDELFDPSESGSPPRRFP
jgi:hypothetical protein